MNASAFWRPLIALAVLLNIALVVYVLVNRDPGAPPSTLGEAIAPLVTNTTLDTRRYDLSDRKDSLNIILISMDALRYDHTGLGPLPAGQVSNTPNLDAFAEECVVFHDLVTAASWTLPSHMSMWTGRWPSVHGVINKLKMLSQDQLVPTQLSPGIETFPDVLIRQGRVAAAFTGGAGVQASYGFGRNFDTYLDDKPFAGLDTSAPPALAWLASHRDKPFFLFLHGYDSHGQYPLAPGSLQVLKADYSGPLNGDIQEQATLREKGLAAIQSPGQAPDLTQALSPEDAAFLKRVYAAKVRDADQRLGQFLSQLRLMGLLENSVVAVVSDHGDEFLEHGALDHGATLYQEQLHGIMLIRFPGYARRQDIQDTVRGIDIFPTLFDALGLDLPQNIDGVSLLPLLQGEKLDLPIHAESDYRLFVHLRMIRQGDMKLILDLEDGRRELYDLSVDPLEQNDISSAQPRVTYESEQALRRWMEATRTNPEDYLGIEEKPIEIF